MQPSESSAASLFEMICDEWSWEAVIAPDGGEVPYAEAERMFRHYGVEIPPEGLEEQRFREMPVTPGKSWDREYVQDHTGPIHGWKVDW